MLSSFLPGCHREDPSSPETNRHSPDDAASEEPDEQDLGNYLAYGDGIRLTIEDLDTFIHRTRLISPRDESGRIPRGEPTWMAMPQAQLSMVRSLVEARVLQELAKENNLEVTDQEAIDALADVDTLAGYSPLFADPDDLDEDTRATREHLEAELSELDLDREDILFVSRQVVLQTKVQDALAESFSEEMLRAIYREAHNEIDLVIAAITNSPSSAEIDAAVQRLDSAIRARYRDQRERYFTLGQTMSTVLRIPEEAQDVDAPALMEAAYARARGGEDLVAIAQDLQLVAIDNVQMNAIQNREAYNSQPGDVGIVRQAPGGPFVWKLKERLPGERRPLDRPLRREIASELLREAGIVPSRRVQAQEAQALLSSFDADEALTKEQIDTLVAELEAAGFRAHHTDLFSLRTNGPIPGIGLAEEFSAKLEDLTWESSVTEPTLSRDQILVARMVHRKHPRDEDFDAERDDFREDFLLNNLDRILAQHLMKWQQEHDVRVNMSLVHQHYGQTGKE